MDGSSYRSWSCWIRHQQLLGLYPRRSDPPLLQLWRNKTNRSVQLLHPRSPYRRPRHWPVLMRTKRQPSNGDCWLVPKCSVFSSRRIRLRRMRCSRYSHRRRSEAGGRHRQVRHHRGRNGRTLPGSFLCCKRGPCVGWSGRSLPAGTLSYRRRTSANREPFLPALLGVTGTTTQQQQQQKRKKKWRRLKNNPRNTRRRKKKRRKQCGINRAW